MNRSRLLRPLVGGMVVTWAAAAVAGCGDLGPAVPRVFTQISVGWDNSCALASSGAAYRWGWNGAGELGTGSSSWESCGGAPCSTTPVPVLGRLRFSSVSVGDAAACGVTPGGVAYCWGDAVGLNVQVPNPDPRVLLTASLPVRVVGSLPFAAVSVGGSLVCGVAGTGAAYCWIGYPSTAPSAVAGNLLFSRLSSGDEHVCGVTLGGAAYCWGSNYYGQLGTGDINTDTLPAAVTGGIVFVSVTAGLDHSCGLTAAGAAYCWGRNSSGQLGVADTAQRLTPAAVQGGLVFSALSAGDDHTCGLAVGRAYCWGSNRHGELGVGDSINRTVPTPVGGGLTFADISAGGDHTCGVTSSGGAYCWGWNLTGQLGDGTSADSPTPVAVGGPP